MSDPAIEAAQKAGGGVSSMCHLVAVGAARVIAKSVQELHTPFEVYGAEGRKFCSECSRLAALNIKWPCETAKRVYPSEELER